MNTPYFRCGPLRLTYGALRIERIPEGPVLVASQGSVHHGNVADENYEMFLVTRLQYSSEMNRLVWKTWRVGLRMACTKRNLGEF